MPYPYSIFLSRFNVAIECYRKKAGYVGEILTGEQCPHRAVRNKLIGKIRGREETRDAQKANTRQSLGEGLDGFSGRQDEKIKRKASNRE